MVVLLGLIGIDAPSTRHSKVEHEGVSAIGIDQTVFGAAAKASDTRSHQPLAKIDRQRSAKVWPTRFDRSDAPALQHPIEAANSRFNFGEFRHRRDMAERRQAR